MNTETLEYKGYKITVAQDDSPENPFESWDCEPPLITYYGGRHEYAKSYQGAPKTIGDVVRLMPDACFDRGQRVALIKAMLPKYTLREFAEYTRDNSAWSERGSEAETRETFIALCNERVQQVPHGWGDAIEWFEMAESLLKWAGIECLNTESNGYCQGDSTLVMAIATPEWVQLVGAPADSLPRQLQCAVDLYSAWAWGDVYGVSAIHAPSEDEDEEGEELDDGSCWGFYGRDHEESGLMEHARDAIDYHISQQQETALNEPACLI
jgi:hypothetical protein